MLPGAACSLSRQQRLCVWNCCADTDHSGIPLGKSRLGNFGVKDSFLTCMLGYWVLHSHRPADGQSSGGSFSCSVDITPELLCLWQSCPPSCITKENFPDVLRLTDSSTLFFVVQSKMSWFSFLRCIRSPSLKQRKVFIILWHLASFKRKIFVYTFTIIGQRLTSSV